MQRRELIKLFAAAATSLCANVPLPGKGLLPVAAPASGAGKAPIQLAAVLQESPAPEPLLPLFPLMLVLFPRTNLALHIFEERYKEMIRDCLQNQWEFGLLLVQEGVLETTGCTASITEVVRKYPDGRMDILVQGKRRFEISMLNQEKSYLRGQPQFFDDDAAEPSAELPRQQAIQLYRRLMELLEVEDELSKGTSPALNDPQLSFQMMAELPADLSWKQSLLSLRSERERLIRVNLYLQEWIDHLEGSPGQQPPAGKA